jgi:hypothetical protein
MKNADMPAMPIPNGADERPWTTSDMVNPDHVFGFTKREELEARMAVGLLSSGYYNEYPQHRVKDVVDEAIDIAAELIDRWDKQAQL